MLAFLVNVHHVIDELTLRVGVDWPAMRQLMVPGRIIFVGGIAGSGKTTLCATVLANCRGIRHEIAGNLIWSALSNASSHYL